MALEDEKELTGDKVTAESAEPEAVAVEAADPAATDGAGSAASPSSPTEPAPGTGEGAAAEEPQASSPASKISWQDRRFKQEYARRKALEKEKAAQAAEVADLREKLRQYDPEAVAPEPAGPIQSQAAFDLRVQEEAARLAAQNAFNARCNAVAEEAKAAYPDFQGRLAGFQQTLDPGNPDDVRKYQEILQAVLAAPEPAAVLHDLLGNVDSVHELMELPVAERAVRIATMAVGRKQDPGVSKAPKPLPATATTKTAIHVEPNAGDPEWSQHVSLDEWMAQRNREVREAKL
jgi:hypothetical protein